MRDTHKTREWAATRVPEAAKGFDPMVSEKDRNRLAIGVNIRSE